MRYKKMIVVWEEDGEEFGEIIVVPDYVTPLDAMSDEPHDCLCSCFTNEGADLIVKLLNKHYGEH